MRMRLLPFELALEHPFTISRGSQTVQPTLIVELADDEGHLGYGEATTNSYYGVTIESMTAALEAVRPQVEAWKGEDPEKFWGQLDAQLTENRFAQCALDLAAWDLHGKRQGQPLWQSWGLKIEIEELVPSCYTIGLASIEEMIAKLAERPDWPVYKIKLGAGNDLEIVRALREHTEATFRVDANCGWTVEQTLALREPLAQLDVELIEQPLPPDIQEEAGGEIACEPGSALPLIVADESCVDEADVDPCAAAGFDGINIKLVKCGGLTPARRMIARARELGLAVMVGCMTESSVGISAAAQLLPLVDFADLDGAELLARDIAIGVSFPRGRCQYAAAAGTGASLLEAC